MDTSRITASIWPWGTKTREEMELAAKEVSEIGYHSFESVKAAVYAYDLDLAAYKEVCDRYDLHPVSFYFHLPQLEQEEEFFSNIDNELDFIARLDVKLISLQATGKRPDPDNPLDMPKECMEKQLSMIARFAEKSQKFGIQSNLHPHRNTWVQYEKEIDYMLQNLDAKLLAFVPDTAHLVRGNCDPVEVVRRYADRVRFTHFKDIKGPDANITESLGMASAGMEVFGDFCELGTGIVDFRSIFDILKAAGYDGPLCEELDKAPISNAISAKNNYDYLLKNW